MIPILFTFGSKYGNKVVFGLLEGLDIWPIRTVVSNKVQRLGDQPLAGVPDKLVLVAAGDACMGLLEEAEMLEPILMGMAGDMYQAFTAGNKIKPPRIPKRPKPWSYQP